MRTGIKRILLAAVLVFSLAGAFAFVGSTKSEASTGRDCSTNSIDNKDLHGGCGAMSPSELIADLRTNNPSDLQTIYAHFGLTTSKYDRFAKTAKEGTAHRDGRIVVGGQTVMTDAQSFGREKFNGQRQAEVIGGKTYFHSALRDSFADGVESLPVMVMFDSKGVAEIAVLNPCGNPVRAKPVKPVVACKELTITSKGNDNYDFTSSVSFSGPARFDKVVYNFGDGSPTVSRTNPREVVSHHFTQSSTITVTAFFTVPGGQQVAVTSDACKKQVVVKKVTPPTPPTPPVTPPALPVTGAGDILGIFAATSAGGAIAHRVVWSRRRSRD